MKRKKETAIAVVAICLLATGYHCGAGDGGALPAEQHGACEIALPLTEGSWLIQKFPSCEETDSVENHLRDDDGMGCGYEEYLLYSFFAEGNLGHQLPGLSLLSRRKSRVWFAECKL